jgi:hypothetical protein
MKKSRDYGLTKSDVIFDQIFNLIGLWLIPITSLLAILYISENLDTSFYDRMFFKWVLLVVIAGIFWGFSLLMTRKIITASNFHILISISFFLFSSTALAILLLFAPILIGKNGWFVSFFFAISFAIGYSENYLRKFRELSFNENILIASGRLDKVKGVWNIEVPLQIEQEELIGGSSDYPRLAKFAPGIPQAIAILLSIIFGLPTQPILMVILLLVWVYVSFWNIGNHLAVFAYLITLEKEISQKITITKNDR